MLKNIRILRSMAIGILLICTVQVVYSANSNPLDFPNIIFLLAITGGFIVIGFNKNGKGE